MQKKYLLFFLFLSVYSFAQNFDSFASGIRINNTIYNVTGNDPVHQVNSAPDAAFFSGASLGTFANGSACGSITASEVKTWKNASGNVCSVTLHWRVYEQSAIPGAFATVSLNEVNDCNNVTNIFDDGFGPCAPNDQKWKDYSLNTNFLNGLSPGSYNLEIFYSITGSDINTTDCEATHFVSNFGTNFTASFSIATLASTPAPSAASVCEGASFTLNANAAGGTAPYTYLWQGPNGFTSTDENPVIASALLSHNGSYSLTVTDSCGNISSPEATFVTVNENVVPTFDALLPAICRDGFAPILVNQSTNGITGTWSPSVVSNTVTGTYIFTPDAGLCAVPISQTIFVVNNVTPTFNLPAAICYGSPAPVLPVVSANGIFGSWSPAVIDNLADGTYTFTPAPGQCAIETSRSITVTTIIPSFGGIPPICEDGAVPVLPNVSANGITGSWSPATISNTASASYTFTPNPGQCAPTASMNVTVVPNLVPEFDQVPPFCEGDIAPVLPASSTNGVPGTWSPATVNNTNSATYTFTPTLCGPSVTMDIEVLPLVIPIFDPIDSICSGAAAPVLPAVSNNGISGTWNPSTVNNLASGSYTFTPSPGADCLQPVTINVTVNPIVNAIFPSIPTICAGEPVPVLPTISDNGIEGTWTPSVIDNTITGDYVFTPLDDECASPLTVTVTIAPNITPTFPAVPPICEGAPAPVLPLVSNNGISGTWSPAIVSNLATDTYTFTPDAGTCAMQTTLTVNVDPILNPSFSFPVSICAGAAAPALPLVSDNGFSGTWVPATIDNTVSAAYTFTPSIGECANPIVVNITVEPVVLPTFASIPPFCAGDTAPILPSISIEGISGSWSPSAVSNTTSGSYTFTPDAGICALPTSLNITVDPNIIPSFPPFPAICEGDAAPGLPPVSQNGITGTWTPAVVSNTATATYTFTPDAGICAVPATMTVTVNPLLTPSFSFDTQICVGAVVPVLPLISENGIIGTWNPVTVSNIATATYTFTPTGGVCAEPVSIQITVDPIVLPQFAPIDPICEGSTPPVLPLTSLEGIAGSWAPSSVSNSASGLYIFTPAPGECALPSSLSVTVTPNETPVFDAIPPICASAPAPVLPLMSNNGITGSWSPALVSNTETGTYTFTPTAGICATPVTLEVVVEPNLLPTFSFPTQYCAGDTVSALPLLSDNGISGTWSSPAIDNAVSAAYTFTPDAGLCAFPVAVVITITPVLTPIFSAIAPICEGSTVPSLPAISDNGIAGSWNPPTISNSASGTYTFTPNVGVCATVVTLNVTVTPNTVPTFTAVPPICSGDTPPVLPLVSTNGISGTWTPATVSNTSSDTYTFTPDGAVCSLPVTMTITVNPIITPAFSFETQMCAGDASPTLPLISDNGISGTWAPATVDNTTSGAYTFTPSAAVCAVPMTVSITVNPIVTPVFTAITPICSGGIAAALPGTSLNGITGTWSPDQIGTASSAIYTFTPAAGQCAVAVTMDVTIVVPVTPMFTFTQNICEGDTAPVLPLTSDNGVPGTWNPDTVSNTSSGNYIFTPDPAVCALPVTVTITVQPIVTPLFSVPLTVCSGAAGSTLPLISDNGISGTWNPATINTGVTTSYTFTPAAGTCSLPMSITIDVLPMVTPGFSAIGPICESSIPPVLPLVSDNGIPGTWNPATVDNTATAVYTFTPAADQCAFQATMTIIVTPNTEPQFDTLLPICAGDAAQLLPGVSLNGISGIWNPPTINNMAGGTYTFTPDAGICAPSVTLTQVVNPIVTPQFNPIPSICSGTPAPLLQPVSNEGITGTWNPALISNTVSATYTFTPDAGQCAAVTAVLVNVTPIATPTFAIDLNICEGSTQPALPLTSTNGIAGTWNPAVVDNTVTTSYTFTPDMGECATGTTVTITVNPLVTPIFDQIAAICSGTSAPALSAVSLNGIAGFWTPSVISNTASGTYTFTPDGTQCSIATTMDIVVNSSPDDLELVTTNVMNGAAAGVITVASVGSGTAPFEYSINGSAFGSDNVFTNLLPGDYHVSVRDVNGCEYSQEASITSACKVPKGLSPNNDGDNDVLIVNGCSVSSLEIFNRYGTTVRKYKTYNNDWDGTSSNGDELPTGTYFYVAQTTDGEKSGWIYLQR